VTNQDASHPGVLGSLRNNVFSHQSAPSNNTGVLYGVVVSSVTNSRVNYADYNNFGNIEWAARANTSIRCYWGMDAGPHDVGTDAGQVDPMFAQARPALYPMREENVWNRAVVSDDGSSESRLYTVAQLMAYYRARYMPASGSPLLDAGDPADAAGDHLGRRADIGAIDRDGHDADKFGTFGLVASGDATAPLVSLTSPAGGATVTGTVSLSASASDAGGSGLTGVVFLVDGKMAGTDFSAPYAILYDVSGLSNGSHTFAARAFDGAGNTATSLGVTVSVANAVDAVPPSSPKRLTIR
jgi:hypothetical protein